MQPELSILIKEHRHLAQLSQTALATLAGVGKTVIFDLEHGKESVQLDTVKKVLEALNIKMKFESPLLTRKERNSLQQKSRT